MALPKPLRESKFDNEEGKFIADKGGNTAVNTVINNDPTNPISVSPGGFVPGGYDYIGVAYPSASTVRYTYRSGGASGTILGEVLVTYTDATLDFILSVEKL